MPLWASVVADGDLEGGLVGVRHGGPDSDVGPPVGQTRPLGFAPDELLLRLVVHLVVKVLVARFVHVEDSHRIPVGVEVEVVRHREHHRDPAVELQGGHVLEVVGEDGHRATCRVRLLDEEGVAVLVGAERGRQGRAAGAAHNMHAWVAQGERRGLVLDLDAALTVSWETHDEVVAAAGLR